MNQASFQPSTDRSPPPLPVVPQQRNGQRFDLNVIVDMASDHNFFTGFSWNISEGGLFVATHELLPVGTCVSLTFQLPGEETPIEALAEVRWLREHNEHSDSPPGVGLRFRYLDDASGEAVQRFIEAQREPLFYEE